MWIIQVPKKVALWNKRHFEQKHGKCAACLKYSVLIFVEKKIHKMQHLEGSGTPILYIGRTVPKGYRCQNVTVFYTDFLFISKRCYLQRHFTKLWATTDGIYTAEQTSVPWNCLNCFNLCSESRLHLMSIFSLSITSHCDMWTAERQYRPLITAKYITGTIKTN